MEKDILCQMAFRPMVGNDVKLMDDRIFRDAPMGLGEHFHIERHPNLLTGNRSRAS